MFSTALVDVFHNRAEERLTLDEERAAIAAAQLGDEAAKLSLILAYAPALRNGVAWYTRALPSAPQASELEDVQSQAVLGLLEAIAAFDADVHDRLAAIAPGYIRNAVSGAAASVTGFAVPERTLKRFFGILREAQGNVYEAARIAPSREMKPETFLAVLSAIRNVDSLEGLTDEGERHTGASHRGEASASPLWDNSTPDVEDRILVEAAFAAVNTLEADVCRLAYGFSDYEPVPDAEIAARLGSSRATIQRTRAGALGKMREALGVA
jgi:DNA-directed RNA polymerase specialized sigma subunit